MEIFSFVVVDESNGRWFGWWWFSAILCELCQLFAGMGTHRANSLLPFQRIKVLKKKERERKEKEGNREKEVCTGDRERGERL